jgi:hypothetical protein
MVTICTLIALAAAIFVLIIGFVRALRAPASEGGFKSCRAR